MQLPRPRLHYTASRTAPGLFAATMQDPDTWRGLAVAPEHRCAPYNRADYPYPQSIEARIVSAQGGMIYGPYSGRLFRSTLETDIEHVVAVSEAHDSGLCAADAETRRRFATDLLNLTLASPEMNRCGKSGKCAFAAIDQMPIAPATRPRALNAAVEETRRFQGLRGKSGRTGVNRRV